MTAVPTIDLLLAERDPAERTRLDAACRDHGFFLLSNHGIQAQIDAMWQASEDFFSQPADRKRKLLRSEKEPLGFYDRELTKRKRDLKEVFDFMPPREEGDMNQWPEDNPGFKTALIDFTDHAGELAARTLRLIYLSLNAGSADNNDLPQGKHRNSNIRLNYYPVRDPLSADEAADTNELGDMALHHHTDPGILTLLVQDNVGGLQTESLEEGWIDVAPQPGTIVVNLGDAMQVWTNDAYRAAIHRVTPRHGEPRYSTPYFFSPASDAVLTPLAALNESEPKYSSFTWKEFIQARVNDNYADFGAEDTQISNYLLEPQATSH